MPILIKSSRGQRSCQLLNNGTPKTNTTIDDIIEALKGLTFKFEVKIADISLPDPVDSELRSANNSQEGTVNSSKPPVAVASAVPVPETRPAQPRQESVQPKEQPVAVSKPAPPKQEAVQPVALMRPPQLREQVTVQKKLTPHIEEKPIAPKPLKTNPQVEVKPLKVERSPEPQIDTPEVAPKPSSKLIRGELKIGDIKTGCLIAVNDSTPDPIAYISYDEKKLFQLVNSIDQIIEDIESSPRLTSVAVGDIVFAKSLDDNKWYRSIIEAIEGDSIHIYFFDWGLRETLSINRIRHLISPEMGLAKFPACALKLRFIKTPDALLQQVLTCEIGFRMLVESYDESTECYQVRVLDLESNQN